MKFYNLGRKTFETDFNTSEYDSELGVSNPRPRPSRRRRCDPIPTTLRPYNHDPTTLSTTLR